MYIFYLRSPLSLILMLESQIQGSAELCSGKGSEDRICFRCRSVIFIGRQPFFSFLPLPLSLQHSATDRKRLVLHQEDLTALRSTSLTSHQLSLRFVQHAHLSDAHAVLNVVNLVSTHI